jgi:hypothetical protein
MAEAWGLDIASPRNGPVEGVPDRIKSPLLCQLSYAGRLFDLRD